MDQALEIFHDIVGRKGEDISSLQMTARAVLVFVYGVIVLRLAGTRIFGKSAPLDIIMSVIIGSNLSRTLTGNAPVLPVFASTAALLALHWLMAIAARHNRPFATLVKGKALVLVRDGVIDEAAMDKEEIGRRDLDMALRDAGLEDIEDVHRAVLERDGGISILTKE